MKVNVIVALYYPHYYGKVRKEIFSIFKNTDLNIIFVDNSNKIVPENEPALNVQWLKGSNTAGEFSAWDEGYSLLEQSNIKDNDDIVIFMNDTFCHHRFFTIYDRILYRRAVKRCSSKGIYGELNSTGKIFAIHQVAFTAWISSYVFLGRRENIVKLLPLNSASTISEEKFTQIGNDLTNKKVNIPFFSDNLNQHLSNWLFPKNESGWYNAGKISGNQLLFKLKAIINEKLLTYNAINNNLDVNDIYQGKINRIYNSVRNKLFIYFNKK